MAKNITNRRKLLLGLGAVAFIGGVALLAFGAFTAFNGGPDHKSGPAVELLTDTPTPSPLPVTEAPTPTPQPSPPFGSEAYNMVIDKLGVNAPVQAFGLDANEVPEVPTGPGQGPGQIVAWYNFTAQPGTGSNAVFAGHVTWNGAAVFYYLTSLAVGDEIKLVGQDGTVLSYKVSDVFDVDPNDPNAIQVMSGSSNDEITIITCDGTTTYIGGTFGVEYNKRLVIRAGLQQVTPGSAVAAAGSNSGG